MIGRRLVVPLIVVGSVAAGGVAGAVMGVPGLSGASTPNATQSKTTAPSGRTGPARLRGAGGELEAAAKALGLTTQQLLDKLKDGKTTIADVAKQQNVDLDKVVDAMVGADRQRIEDFVNHALPLKPGAGGGARAKGGPGIGRAFGIGGEFEAAAKALGISAQDLKHALRDGKTIAQIAKDRNVDLNKVIDAIVGDATKRIDEAQSNGKLTKEQADKIKSALKEHVTSFVNGEGPKFGGMGRGHGGPWAPPGP